MKKNFVNSKTLAVLTFAAVMASCNKNEDRSTVGYDGSEPFHLGIGISYSGRAQGAVLPLSADDLKNPQKTYDFSKGYNLEPARTHRFYSTHNGTELFNLEYGNGNIVKYIPNGASTLYDKKDEINVKEIIGATHPRWRVVNSNTGIVYNPKVEDLKEGDKFVGKKATLNIVSIDLKNLSLGKPKQIELPKETHPSIPNLSIWRVDSPIISNGKVYFGVAKKGYDKTTGKPLSGEYSGSNDYPASTLVLDYPSFENPKVISSSLGKGQTYGYRAPAYFEYNGSVYHVNMEDSRLFKITNGEYDNSYDFSISKALGENVSGTGIFYASNGIAYMPYYKTEKGSKPTAAAWGVALIDINQKTAIKMNMPENLWLNYYQNARVGKDGKLYMAICPVKANGNIYIFDPTQKHANGFEKGATLKVKGEGFYLGIF